MQCLEKQWMSETLLGKENCKLRGVPVVLLFGSFIKRCPRRLKLYFLSNKQRARSSFPTSKFA